MVTQLLGAGLEPAGLLVKLMPSRAAFTFLVLTVGPREVFHIAPLYSVEDASPRAGPEALGGFQQSQCHRPGNELQGESWEREGGSGDLLRIRAMLRWTGYLDIPVTLPR